MAKGEAKKVNKAFNTEKDRINREADRFGGQLWGRVPYAIDKGDRGWNVAQKGYEDILNDPNFGARSGGGGGGGGYGQYENMFKNFANTGGLDSENISRIRGKGVFDEFAKTGGYSDADIANIRSRSNATIPAFYEALRNRMDQMNRVSGGSPSYGASEGRMARDQFRQGAAQALDTEVGIKDKVNEGRRWGSSSMSSAEQGLSELLSRNKLAGMEGGLRAAGMSAADSRAADEMASRNRFGALEGIRGLRTDVPGEEFGLYDFLLRNQGQRGQLSGGNLGNYSAYNPNVSVWDRVAQLGSAGAGIAQGLSGIPNPFKKKPKSSPTGAHGGWF